MHENTEMLHDGAWGRARGTPKNTFSVYQVAFSIIIVVVVVAVFVAAAGAAVVIR